MTESPNQPQAKSVLKHQMVSKCHVTVDLKDSNYSNTPFEKVCLKSWKEVTWGREAGTPLKEHLSWLGWITDEYCSIIAVGSTECQMRDLSRMHHNYHMASILQLYDVHLSCTLLSD